MVSQNITAIIEQEYEENSWAHTYTSCTLHKVYAKYASLLMWFYVVMARIYISTNTARACECVQFVGRIR